MDKTRLDKWAERLLDTGKRSNLVNFKDTKSSTLEILAPSAQTLFDRIDSSSDLEILDIKDGYPEEAFDQGGYYGEKYSREVFATTYSRKLRKNQLLAFNSFNDPITVIKSIHKKARAAIEETGVNVAYMAFGFVSWKDKEMPECEYKAPLLLIPIIFRNESAIEPYYVKFTDDEVVVNPTFSFRMNSEYGVRLPDYEGEGLSEYLSRVEAIVSRLGWRVSAGVRIGIFSFLKLNMYKDLKDNADSILENENVRLILGDYSGANDFAQAEECEESELHNVVDADSSQLDAIKMAKAGKSFVIQGPPGTGKSQTITNLIAECLADGKRVLFVSEKLAALRVVYEKLKRAGLEDFCLELHSHKANKKEFIEELCRTLRQEKSGVSLRAETVGMTLEKYSGELNKYAEELHRTQDGIGMSLYQLYSAYSSVKDAPDVDYAPENIRSLDGEYLVEALRVIMQYAEFAESFGKDYKSNVFHGIRIKDASHSESLRFKKDLARAKASLDELCELSILLSSTYGIKAKSADELISKCEIFEFLSDASAITPPLCDKNLLKRVSELLDAAAKQAKGAEKTEIEIKREYDSDVFDLDSKNLAKRIKIEFGSFFSRLFSKDYRRILTSLRLCRRDEKKPRYAEAIEILRLLETRREQKERLLSLVDEVCDLSGAKIAHEGCDFDALRAELRTFDALLSRDGDAAFFKKTEASEFQRQKESLAATAAGIRKALDNYATEEERIKERFSKGKCRLATPDIQAKSEACSAYLSAIDTLEGYVRYLRVIDGVYKAGLGGYIETVIESDVSGEDMAKAYSKAFYRTWIDSVISSSPLLRDFTRSSQDRAVEMFSENDLITFEVNKARIRSMLSRKRPELDLIAPGSAVSVLVREGEKSRRQKSIRALISDIGELIQLLKPCLLMSPLSVSTYLDSGRMNFDVVVFDEASQIFPEDAIGAIYRAKQVIVVGDSNQMPPSNFFSSSVEPDDEELDEPNEERYESILDLCSTAMPELRLKWHYRSKYEQLIAFSNKHFYSGELITFPSSSRGDEWHGIAYHHVDGVFEHKKRTNRKEAEAVVDLIYKSIREYPDRSLGVVAFSISQQELIDSLLSKRRLSSPEAEFFFRHDRAEPFFIKNLETVQGDERDTIIFSTAYGKDDRGVVMHNFGPLNRSGGERRLNVAVTRAKTNLHIVSSMRSTDIDLRKARSRGARLLKEYLAYAEGGGFTEGEKEEINPFARLDRGFENEVADFLVSEGFSVEKRLGCSRFKIDIAVKNPDESRYALAIECDGENYAATKSVRDRDRLRPDVLRAMGWDVYRVWSTDWYKNTAKEKQKLLLAVKNALSCTSDDSSFICTSIDDTEELEADATTCEGFEMEYEKECSVRYYEYADIDGLLRDIPDDFIAFVKEVLKKEAPLSEESLIRRILSVFGTDRLTGSVIAEFECMMKGCEAYGIIRRGGFMFLEGEEIYLRQPREGDPVRDVKYISLEELRAGLIFTVKSSVKISRDGLYHAVSQALGYSRLTPAISARLDEAMLISADVLSVNKDIVYLS